MTQRLQAVIFDWAGTIVDYGSQAPIVVFKEVLMQFGIEITMEEARKPMGLDKRDHLREIFNMDRVSDLWYQKYGRKCSEEDINEIYSKLEPMLSKIVSDYSDPIPGAVELFKTLKYRGIKIGTTTGYLNSMMEKIIPVANEKGLNPDSIVTPTDVPKGRPTPWMCYQNAINMQSFPMSAMIKIGDTIADIKEGLNAGMWVIGLSKSGNEAGFTQEELNTLHESEINARVEKAASKLSNAGAHFIAEGVWECLPVIEEINRRIEKGETPKNFNAEQKILYTPGPLNTSMSVKEAMLIDYGSRDSRFIDVIRDIRNKLLNIAEVNSNEYDTILMQGAGTFGVESVLSSNIGKEHHIAVIINGAYGERISKICNTHNLKTTNIVFEEDSIPDIETIENYLKNDDSYTHIAIVHCETTTGIFNNIESVGKLAKQYGLTYIVDAMSSFGAVEIDFQSSNIDFLISSSNKCIEGVPGFSFIIARNEKIEQSVYANTLSLNLKEQRNGLNKNGQFRFTPPVHSLMAFNKALNELIEEGGVKSRALKYQKNNKLLMDSMLEMNFVPYLSEDLRGYIINTFHYPKDNDFDFEEFYSKLNDKGIIIYPGKLTKERCFRLGNIGKISDNDIKKLLSEIKLIVQPAYEHQ